jgi:hypothetical protein
MYNESMKLTEFHTPRTHRTSVRVRSGVSAGENSLRDAFERRTRPLDNITIEEVQYVFHIWIRRLTRVTKHHRQHFITF